MRPIHPQISPIAVSTSTSRYLQLRFQPHITTTFRSRPHPRAHTQPPPTPSLRSFSASISLRAEDATSKAKALNQKGLDKEVDGFHKQIDNAIGKAKELQARTPWHREGSDQPPVKRNRSAGAMTKGIFRPTLFQNQITTRLCTQANMYFFRQTPNNPLPPPEAHPPSNNRRQEHRPQRYRAPGSPRPPSTTSLLP